MTVTKKMILLVASALLGIVGLAGFSQYEMGRVYAAANFSNENVVPSLVLLGDASAALSNIRPQVWQHIAQNNPDAKTDIDKNLNANQQKIDAALKAYDPLVVDSKDKDLLAADRAALTEYAALREKALLLSRQNKFNEARDLIMANLPILAKVATAFDEHIDYNVTMGKKAAAEAVAVQQHAGIMAIIVATCTLLLIAGIGFFINRNLMRQLGGEPDYAADITRKIAAGDLSVTISLREGDDKSLLAAMKSMVAKLAQVINETQAVVSAATHGDLSQRIVLSDKQGFAKELGTSINSYSDTCTTIMQDMGRCWAPWPAAI